MTQQEKATADCDYLGISKSNNGFKFNYDNNELQIEVKTRHAQSGNPYLLGVKLNKFDLLVFVFLNEDYSCNYIGILDKNDLQGHINGKQNRLVFRNSLKVIWETDAFVKLK